SSALCAIQKTLRSLTRSLMPPAEIAIASNSISMGELSSCLNHNVMPAGVSMSSAPWRTEMFAGFSASTTQYERLAKSSEYSAGPDVAQPASSATATTTQLLDVRNDPVELVERVIADDKLPLAR